MSKDYKVGYGKPPRSDQWKPGQSGNPKGRCKRNTAFLKEAAEILSEPVTAKTASGSAVTLGALEASYLKLCQQALKGDDAALNRAILIMLEVLQAGETTKEELDAETRGAKRKFWAMAGLPPEDYPGLD